MDRLFCRCLVLSRVSIFKIDRESVLWAETCWSIWWNKNLIVSVRTLLIFTDFNKMMDSVRTQSHWYSAFPASTCPYRSVTDQLPVAVWGRWCPTWTSSRPSTHSPPLRAPPPETSSYHWSCSCSCSWCLSRSWFLWWFWSRFTLTVMTSYQWVKNSPKSKRNKVWMWKVSDRKFFKFKTLVCQV